MYLRKEKQLIFSIEEVKMVGQLIDHNGNKYTLREWYKNTADFRKNGDGSFKLRNSQIKLPKSYLGKIFTLNAKKHSFYGLILPASVFLIISLVISYCCLNPQDNAIIDILEINQESIIFLGFLGAFFCFIGLALLYKLLIKRTKIVYTKMGKPEGYRHLANDKFREIMMSLDEENYISFKPIDTYRLTIRELEESDVEDYYYFASSKIVHKYLASAPLTSIDEALKTIRNTRNQYHDKLLYKLAIIRRMDNRLIGYIGLSKQDLSLTTCQVIYAIHQDYWGQGYVGEALVAFVEYLKTEGKQIIIAGHVEENYNSGKVLLKSGFKRDPNRDSQMIIHGEAKNIISYLICERKEKK